MQDIEGDGVRRYLTEPSHAFCVDLPVRSFYEHEAVTERGGALLALLDGQAVGFILLLPVDGRAHILEISVRLLHQGGGIGRALLNAGEAWAMQTGYTEVTLTTFRDIPWNEPAYLTRGYRAFQPCAEHPHLLAIQAEERASGFEQAPRLAMVKAFRGTTSRG